MSQSDKASKTISPKAGGKQPVVKKHVALLDAEGVLIGFDAIPPEAFNAATMVEVGPDCDLKPGKYQWDFGRGTFLPIRKPGDPVIDMNQETVPAIFEALMVLRTAGQVFSERTTRWLDWYQRTVDAKSEAAEDSTARGYVKKN